MYYICICICEYVLPERRVLLEGLRIRLTSHYNYVEAAGWGQHLIIHNCLLTFPPTRCQDNRPDRTH